MVLDFCSVNNSMIHTRLAFSLDPSFPYWWNSSFSYNRTPDGASQKSNLSPLLFGRNSDNTQPQQQKFLDCTLEHEFKGDRNILIVTPEAVVLGDELGRGILFRNCSEALSERRPGSLSLFAVS